MIIDEILSLAQKLLGLRDTMSQATKDRRERLAAFFEQIAATLADISAHIRTGDRSVAGCARLDVFADCLVEVVGDQLSQVEVTRLVERLRAASSVRALLFELHKAPTDRDQQLDKLDAASGIFGGLSVAIKAGL